ncbi:uncharacterized protein LOC135494132 isoform X2 [Lineus longissimus]|uniref:uncharacterized protein LOC135494132 isoform X2 n=1 Tax=Lineus longissimus TaxID=88925 RepID=UPI00315DCCF0
MSIKRRGSSGLDQGVPMPNVLLNSPKKEPDMAEPKVTKTHMLPKSTARKSCYNIGKKLEAEQLLGTLDNEEQQKLQETMQGGLGQKRRPAEAKNIFSILNESKDCPQEDVVERDVVVIEDNETSTERSVGSKPVRAGVFSSLSKSFKALNPSLVAGRKSGTQSPVESTTSGRKSQTPSPTGSTGTDQKSRTRSPSGSDASGQKSRTQSPSESIQSGQRSRLQSPDGSVTSELALDESGHEPNPGEASVKSRKITQSQQSRSRVGRLEFSSVDFDLILPGRSRSQRSSSGQRDGSSLESNKPSSKLGAKNSNAENNLIPSQRSGRSRRSSPALVSPFLPESATSSSSVALRRLSKSPSAFGKDDANKCQIRSGANSKAAKTSSGKFVKAMLKIPLKEQTFAEASFNSDRHTLSSPDTYFDDSPVTRLRRFDFSPRSRGFYKAIAHGLKHVTPKALPSAPSEAKNRDSDTEKSSARSPRSSSRGVRRYSYDELLIPFGRDESDSGRRLSRSARKAAQSSDNGSPSPHRKGTDMSTRYIYFDDSHSDSDSSVKVHPNVKSLLMHLEESKSKKKVPVICLENITDSPTSADQSVKLVNPDLEKEFAASIPTEAKRKLNFSSVLDLEKDTDCVVTDDKNTVPKNVERTGKSKTAPDVLKENAYELDKADGQANSAVEETGEDSGKKFSSGGSEPMQGVSSEGDGGNDGAKEDICDRAPPSPCTTEPVKHGLLFGLIEKMQTRIPGDVHHLPPEPEPEDEESSEQTSVREDVESSESSEEVSEEDSSDDSEEESESMDTLTKNHVDSGSSEYESESEEDSDTDSSEDEEEGEEDRVVASTSAAYQEDSKLVAAKVETEAESMEVDDEIAVKSTEKIEEELSSNFESEGSPGQIPTLVSLAEAANGMNIADKSIDEMPKLTRETKELKGECETIRMSNEKSLARDAKSNDAADNTSTLDLLKILDDNESRSSEFGRTTPKLFGKLPISVEDKLHVVPRSSSGLLETDEKEMSEDEGLDLSAVDAEVGTEEPETVGSQLLAYLTDHEYLNKSLADIQIGSKENTPELERAEMEKKLTAEEQVFSDEERLAVSLPFKMFEKSDASAGKSNAFISSELESYLDTKSDLQSDILQCDKKLTNSEKIMKYTFGGDVHIDEDAVTPDLDNIDGILFMSFDSEESLEAHTVVEYNKKICSWHSSFYHRMKYVLNEQERRMAKIENSLVQSQITKKWKPLSERMAKYRRMLTNQVMKIKKRNLMKKKKDEAQKAEELAKQANDLVLLERMTTEDLNEADPDADVGSAYLHRTGKLHWRTQERLLKNLTPDEAKELQSELGLTLKKKRRKLVPFTHKKNTMEKHGSDHSMSPEERPSAAGSFDQLYQTFGANDGDKAEEQVEGVEALDDDEQVQLVQDAVTELLNEDKKSSENQSRYKHPLMRSRSIFETFDIERPKIPSPTKPRQLLTQGSKSSFNMFKCDLQGLMKRRLQFKNEKLGDPMKGRKRVTTLTITGQNITDIVQPPDLPEHSEEMSADDDCCIVSEDDTSTLNLDDGKLQPQIVNERMALFAASAIRLVKAVQRKGKMVFELEEPPKTSYLTQNRALARALQAAPRTAVKAHKGLCDQPGCRYGCVCHLLDPLDPETDSSSSAKNKKQLCAKEYCRLGCICESIGTTSPTKCQKPQCRFVCRCEVPSTSKGESSHLWKEDTPCDKEYCQLGCVCSSVNSFGIGLSKCTKPECRFLCKCPRDEDGNPVDDEPKNDLPQTRQRRARKESAWLRDMVSWDFLPSIGKNNLQQIALPKSPPQHKIRGKKIDATSDPSFKPCLNNSQRLSIFPKGSQQQIEEQQTFPIPENQDALPKYRCMLPSDAQRYPGGQMPSSSMNQPVFPRNEMSQPVFPRNETAIPGNNTSQAVIQQETGLDYENGVRKLASLHEELSKALPHLNILPPSPKKKKKKKVLPISMPEEATMFPWVATDTRQHPDKTCARVRHYTPAVRPVKCTCCLTTREGQVDECNKFKARLILEQALRRSAAVHKLDYKEKKLPPGLRRRSSDGSSYPSSPGAASLDSFSSHDPHDHLGDRSRLDTKSPQPFSTQMMLLQPKKKDAGKSIHCRPQLLEISSNCQWIHIRSQLLGYVAQQVKDRLYPPVSKVAISTFLIEILPRADRPTRIPPHLQSSLPAEMYSVRILIKPTPSSAEKISQFPAAAKKEELVEVSSDSDDDLADDQVSAVEETCARITPFISKNPRQKTDKKDKSKTREVVKSKTEVVDLTKSPVRGHSKSRKQSKIVDLTQDGSDSEDEGVQKQQMTMVEEKQTTPDDDDDQMTVVAQKHTSTERDISAIVNKMQTSDSIDTGTVQNGSQRDDKKDNQGLQALEDASISKELSDPASTSAVVEMEVSDVSDADGENDHEVLSMRVEQSGLSNIKRDIVVGDDFEKEISTLTEVVSDTDMIRKSETKGLVVEKADSMDKDQSFKDETDQAAILDSLACLKALSESIDPPDADEEKMETDQTAEGQDEASAEGSSGASAEKRELTAMPSENEGSEIEATESKQDEMRSQESSSSSQDPAEKGKLEKDTLQESTDASQPVKSTTRFQSFKSSVFKSKVKSAPYSDLAAIFQTAMPDKSQDKQTPSVVRMRDTCSLSATDVDRFTAEDLSSDEPEPFKTISFSSLPESVKQPLAHQVYSLMLKTPGTNDILALVKIQPLATKKIPGLPVQEVTVKVVCPRPLIMSLNRDRDTCRGAESHPGDDGAQSTSLDNEKRVEELDIISDDQKTCVNVSTEERLHQPNNHTPSSSISGKETCLQAEASSTVDDEQMSALSRRHENLRLSAEPILEKAVNMAKEFWQKLRGKSQDGEADEMGEKTSDEIGAGDAGTSKSEQNMSGAGDSFRLVPDAVDMSAEPDSPDEDVSQPRERNLFETFGAPEKMPKTSRGKEIKEEASVNLGGKDTYQIDVELQQTIEEKSSVVPPGLFGMIYEDITPVPSPNVGLVIAEPDSTVQSRPETPHVDLKGEPEFLPSAATVPMETTEETIIGEPSKEGTPRKESQDSGINDVDDFTSKAAAALADMASSVADELNLETRKNQDVEMQMTESALPPDALSSAVALIEELSHDGRNLEAALTSASSPSKEGAVDENRNPKEVIKIPSKDGDLDTDVPSEGAVINSSPAEESSDAKLDGSVLKLESKEEVSVGEEDASNKLPSIVEVPKLDESSGDSVSDKEPKSADIISKSDSMEPSKLSASSVSQAPALVPPTIMFKKSSQFDSSVPSPGSVAKTSTAIITRDLPSSGIKATFTAQVLPETNTVISFDVKFGSSAQKGQATGPATKRVDSNVPAAKSASELLSSAQRDSHSQPGTPMKGTGMAPGVNAASQNLAGAASVACRVGPRILQTSTPGSPRISEVASRNLQTGKPEHVRMSPQKPELALSGTSTPPVASVPEVPSFNPSERKGRRKEKHSIREMPEDELTDQPIVSMVAKKEVKKRKPFPHEYETLFYKNKKGVGDMPVTVVKTQDDDEVVDVDDLSDDKPEIMELEPSESDVDIEDYDSECELQVVRLVQAASDNLCQFYVNPDCALHCHEEMKRKAKALMISGRQEREKSPEPPPPPVKKKRIRNRKKLTPDEKKKPGPKRSEKKVKKSSEGGEKVSSAAGPSPDQLGRPPLAGPRLIGQGLTMQGVPRPQIQIQPGVQRTPLQGMHSFQIKSTPSPGMQGFQRANTPVSSGAGGLRCTTPSSDTQGFQRGSTPVMGVGGPRYITSSPDMKDVVDDVTLKVIQAMGVKPGQVVSIQRINPNQKQKVETPTRSTPLPVSQSSTPARMSSPTSSTISEPLESGAETPPTRSKDEHCSKERIRRKMMASTCDRLKNCLGISGNTPKATVMKQAIISIRALEFRERCLLEEKKTRLCELMATAGHYGELRFGEIPDVEKRKKFVKSLIPKRLHEPSSIPQFRQFCLISGLEDDNKQMSSPPKKVTKSKLQTIAPAPKPVAVPATGTPEVGQMVNSKPGPTVDQARPLPESKPKHFAFGAKSRSKSKKKKPTKVETPTPAETVDPKRLEERLPYIGCQGTLQRALQRQKVVPNLNPRKSTEENSCNTDKIVEATSEAGESVTVDVEEVPLEDALGQLLDPESDDEGELINVTDSPEPGSLKRKGVFEPVDPNTTKRITFYVRPDEAEGAVVTEHYVEKDGSKINRSRKQAAPQKFIESPVGNEAEEPDEPELDICSFEDDSVDVVATEEVAEEAGEAVETVIDEDDPMSETDGDWRNDIGTGLLNNSVQKDTSGPAIPRLGVFDMCSLEEEHDKHDATDSKSLTTADPGLVSTVPPVIESRTLSTGNYQMVVKRAGGSPLTMSADKPPVLSKEMPMGVDQEEPRRNSTGSRPVTPVALVGPNQRVLTLPASVMSSLTKQRMSPITIASKQGLTTVPLTVSVNSGSSQPVSGRQWVIHNSATKTVKSNSRNFTVPVTLPSSFGRGTVPMAILPKSNTPAEMNPETGISGKFPVPVSVSITPGIGPTAISFPTRMTAVSGNGERTVISTSKSEMIRMPISSLPPGTLLHLPNRSSSASTTAGTVQLRPGTFLRLPDPAKAPISMSGSPVSVQPGLSVRLQNATGIKTTQSTTPGLVRVPVVTSAGNNVPKGTPGYLFCPARSSTTQASVLVKGNTLGKPSLLITGTTTSQQQTFSSYSTAKYPTVTSTSVTTGPKVIIRPMSALPRNPIVPVQGNASLAAAKMGVPKPAAEQMIPSQTSATGVNNSSDTGHPTNIVKPVTASGATSNRIPSAAKQTVWKKMSTVDPETGKIREIPYAQVPITDIERVSPSTTTEPSVVQCKYAKTTTSEEDRVSPRTTTLSPVFHHDYVRMTPDPFTDKVAQPMPALTHLGTEVVLSASNNLAKLTPFQTSQPSSSQMSSGNSDFSTDSKLIMELPKSFTDNLLSPIKANQNAASTEPLQMSTSSSTVSPGPELCNEMLVKDAEAAEKKALDLSRKTEEEQTLSMVLEVRSEQDTMLVSDAAKLSTCAGLPATGSINTITTATCVSSAKTHVSPSKKSVVRYDSPKSQEAMSDDEDVLTIDMEAQLNSSIDALQPGDVPVPTRLFEAGVSELPDELFCRDETPSPIDENLWNESSDDDIPTAGAESVRSLSTTPVPRLDIEGRKASMKSQPEGSKEGQSIKAVDVDSVVTDEVEKPKKKRTSRKKKAADRSQTDEGPEGENEAGGVTTADCAVDEESKRKRKPGAKKTDEKKTADPAEGGENENLDEASQEGKPTRKRKNMKPKLEDGVVILTETSKASVMRVNVATTSAASEGLGSVNRVSIVKASAPEGATGMMMSASVLSSSQTTQTKLPPGKYPIGVSELSNKVIYIQTSKGKIPFQIPENAFSVPTKDSALKKSTKTVTIDLSKSQPAAGGKTWAKIIMPPPSTPVSVFSSTGSHTSILSGSTLSSASMKPDSSSGASTMLTTSQLVDAVSAASIQASTLNSTTPAAFESSASGSSENVPATRTLLIATPSSLVPAVISESTSVTASSSKAVLVASKVMTSKTPELKSDNDIHESDGETTISDSASLKMNNSEISESVVRGCEGISLYQAESKAPDSGQAEPNFGGLAMGEDVRTKEPSSASKDPVLCANSEKGFSVPISVSTPTAGETIGPLLLPPVDPKSVTLGPNTPNMPGRITHRLPSPNVDQKYSSSGPRIRGPNIMSGPRIRGPVFLPSGFSPKNLSLVLRAGTPGPLTGSHAGTSGPATDQKDPIVISFEPRNSGPTIDIISPDGENLGPRKRRSRHGMPDPVIDEIMRPQHAKRERKPTKRFLEADSDSGSEQQDKTPEKQKSKSNKLSPDDDKAFVPQNVRKLKSDTTPDKGSKNVKGSGRKKAKLDAESSAGDSGVVRDDSKTSASGSKSPGIKRKKEKVDVAEDIGAVADGAQKKKRRRKKLDDDEQMDPSVGGMDTCTQDNIMVGVADDVQKKKKKPRKKIKEGEPPSIVGIMDTSAIDENVVKETQGGDVVQQNRVPVGDVVVLQDLVQGSAADDNVFEVDGTLPTKRKRRPKNFGDGMLSIDDVDLRYKVTKAEKAAEKNVSPEKVTPKSKDSVEKKEKKVKVKVKKAEKEQSSIKKGKLDSPGVAEGAIPKSKGRKSKGASVKKGSKSVSSPKKKLAMVDMPGTHSKALKPDNSVFIHQKLENSASNPKLLKNVNETDGISENNVALNNQGVTSTLKKSPVGHKRSNAKPTLTPGKEEGTLIVDVLCSDDEEKETGAKYLGSRKEDDDENDTELS